MKKSFLKVSVMLLMASVTLTSCQDFWDDLFGVESTPTTPETPSTPSESEEPKDDTNLTKTETGAEATVEDLANLTELLNQVKDDIAAKGEEEYVFEIKNEGLESTATDNVIEVPKVEGSNINLNFTNGVGTKETLVVKAAETASDTPVEAVNELTITMPASEGLNLELDMPETTVTLKAATGEVVYDEIVATTAINTLHIGSGVTVKNLRVKGGRVKVKDGGRAETYVYAAESNDDILSVYEEGVQPIPVKDVQGEKAPNVQHENGQPYYFKKLKVIKGTADYANISFGWGGSWIDTLTVAEGVVLKADNNWLTTKVIKGTGNGAVLIMKDNNVSLRQDENKSVTSASCELMHVVEMKGISLSVEPGTQEGKEAFAIADSISFSAFDAPRSLENCTFKFDFISFDNNTYKEKTTTFSAKGCKFEKTSENAFIHIAIPNQTAETPSFRVNFTNCDFSEGFKFSVFADTENIWERDDNDNLIYYEIPFYIYYDENWDERMGGIWRYVQTKDEIPVGATWEECDYEMGKHTLKVYNDYNPTISIKNCRYGSNALSEVSDFIDYEYSYRIAKGLYIWFEIDDKIYEQTREWDSQTQNWKYALSHM